MQNDYWDERFLLLNEMLLQQGEEYINHANSSYLAVMLEIEKEINNFFERFANENQITLQQAQQILTTQERQAFQMELQDYIKYGQQNGLSKEWIKKLENASTVHRITRLQAIQYQFRQQVEKLEAQKVQGITQTLKNIYKDGYYHTAYEIQKGTGIGQAFSKIDENKIEKVLSKSWTADGKNFSERVWGQDRTNLIYQLETRFTQGIIRGEAPQKIIRDISNALNASRKATERLVLTESAFVASASTKESYEKLGVKKYKVLATLDIKTSELCRNMDGKIFDLKDYKIGVTANPFHPRCRSTTMPHIDNEFTQNQQRAARDKNNKTVYVPADMTYKEWYKTYVEKDPEYLLKEKKHQNQYADRKQYENYKAVLGRKEVGSFDDFQNTKYGDSEKWDSLKQKKKQNTPTKTENETDEDLRKIMKRNVKKRKRKKDNIETISYNNLPKDIKTSFEEGLKYAKDDTRELLEKQIQKTQFAFSNEKNSYSRKYDYIKLKTDVPPSTIAHEVFHQIDEENEISKKGILVSALQQDYERILFLSEGNIKQYLKKHYKNAIHYYSYDKIILEKKYRGISDIFSGLTKNEVFLGHGHRNKYWNEDELNLFREAWGQYGRITYDNDKKVLEMFQFLFPNFYQSATMVSKKLLKR